MMEKKLKNKKIVIYRKQLLGLISCIVLLMLFASMAYAAVPPPYPDFPQNPLQFAHLTTEDGLSNDTVQAFLQTQDGFMWFGTRDGLNRYNGYDFEVFNANPDSLDNLQNSDIKALLEDSVGGIWIGTSNGLDWYSQETGAFVHYTSKNEIGSALAGDEISALLEDAYGNIWIGTLDGGISVFSPLDGSI